MKIEITKDDLDALETGYTLFDGYCLDDEEENDEFVRQAKRYKKILTKLNKHYYPKKGE
jgi:hypothetical protein